MLRKLGLAGAVLGTVLSLALPVSGRASERNGRDNRDAGYLSANGNRSHAFSEYRTRFDRNSQREAGINRERRFQNGRPVSRVRQARQNPDRGGEKSGLRDSGGWR
jgi:hypothetical protein